MFFMRLKQTYVHVYKLYKYLWVGIIHLLSCFRVQMKANNKFVELINQWIKKKLQQIEYKNCFNIIHGYFINLNKWNENGHIAIETITDQ